MRAFFISRRRTGSGTGYARIRHTRGSTRGGSGMFRHHAHEKPMTETDRETILNQGAAIQGMVMRNEPSATDPGISQVRISVRFSGDQTAEFSEELANLYQ